MREKPVLLQFVLSESRSILEFIDSDYTFLNESLAQHYGIEGVLGKTFTKVTLRPEHNRGGLLGHGSVLTATSNGVETQPVLRGVWVLENLLGTPPNSPPPDVEPIEPDTRGVSTMRELMEKHRNQTKLNVIERSILWVPWNMIRSSLANATPSVCPLTDRRNARRHNH